MWAANAAIEVSGKRYRYTGMERDDETGMQYHSARYYAPWLGRWTAVDPIGVQGGANLWAYAAGNPVSAVDRGGTSETYVDEDGRTVTEYAQGEQVQWDGYDDEGNPVVVVQADNAVADGDGPTPFSKGVLNGLAMLLYDIGTLAARLGSRDGFDRITRERGELIQGGAFGAVPYDSPEEAHRAQVGEFVGQELLLGPLLEGLGALDDAGRALARATDDLAEAGVAVFRVEGDVNTRVLIGEGGDVAIVGDNMLFLNFGNRSRAEEFLAKRLEQGMAGVDVKSFEVPRSFLDDMRALAVPESEARSFPNNPLVVDPTKAPDQFGLRADQIEALRQAITAGSGRRGLP